MHAQLGDNCFYGVLHNFCASIWLLLDHNYDYGKLTAIDYFFSGLSS
jgi:hypothetical protein